MCLFNCVAVTSLVKMRAELTSPQCLFKALPEHSTVSPLSKAQGLSGRADRVSIKDYPEPPTPCTLGYLPLPYPKCGKYYSKI